MPAGGVCMPHVREMLRLKCTGISGHQIARLTGGTVNGARDAEALCCVGPGLEHDCLGLNRN